MLFAVPISGANSQQLEFDGTWSGYIKTEPKDALDLNVQIKNLKIQNNKFSLHFIRPSANNHPDEKWDFEGDIKSDGSIKIEQLKNETK